MYLSRLDLQGFKSFANKTSVKFDSGITAIVGPNGCGKSNIVDALRWVLGEQRASLLRSSAMQNVIFNGTANKKALGMAEVSVVIENNRDILPLEYSEVTISRRLYRSGESEYLLNGTVCRLKDIIDLFMDTGMGPGAYSVIELKMVEEILNDKNNDRLRLFEEAAGVTRYKEKRRQTLKKLDDTITDLVRVEDILVEIRKKARSLQLQARKAQRAKEYSTQLHQLDLAWNRHEYKRIQDELKPLLERVVEAEKEKENLQQQFSDLEEEEAVSREKLDERESELNKAQRRVNELYARIRDTETNIRINNEKIANEKQVILNFESDINQAENDITNLKRNRASAEKSLQERREALEKATAELQKQRQAYEAVEKEVADLRRQVSESAKKQDEINRQLSDLRSKKIRLESRYESADEDIQRLSKQRNELDEQIFESGKELEKLNGELGDLEKRREDAALELNELRETREQLVQQINEHKDNLRTARSRLDSLESERELLEQIARSHDAFPGSVQYLLKGKKDFSLMEVVTDVLSTSDKYAVALEAALGELCNILIVEQAVDAQVAFKNLKDQKKGRAAIVALEFVDQLNPVVHKDSIAHQVRTEKPFETLKNILLGSVCLVTGVNEGIQKAQKHGVTCVTGEGDVITGQGIIKSGSKQKNIGIRVGLKDRIDALKKQIVKAGIVIRELEDETKRLEEKRTSLNEQQAQHNLQQSEQSLRKTEQKLNTIRSQQQVFERNLKELNQRRELTDTSAAEARQELEKLTPENDRLNAELEKLIESQLELRNQLREKEAQLQRSQLTMNDARVVEQRLRSEAESYQREVEQSVSGIKTIKERLELRAGQAKNSREKINSLSEETVALEENLETFREEKRQADSDFSEVEESTARQRGKIRTLEEKIKQMHRKKEVNTELLHQLEIRQSKLDMHSKSILDYVWENYGKMIEQIDEKLEKDADPNTVKSTIGNLKERLKSIGEVNHLAIEEYEEEQERLEFYESQINDLHEAEEKLRATIKEINKTANERFNNTFVAIRTNFKRVFNLLFEEDDHCDLLLKDKADDPLDNRIEIIAKPRGKRPSNIEQLSGGEKTLTAIALLFAIYLVKPSPFCILDEVDAPLDDANVDRFTNLIRQFSAETQFIVITHNKKTMDKSEVMYGVTMPETGISRLVGVRLDEAKAAS